MYVHCDRLFLFSGFGRLNSLERWLDKIREKNINHWATTVMLYILTERLQINGVENCTEQKGTERKDL